MSHTLELESVSDTAFITAMSRALETERPDACLRDAHARLLAGEQGAALLAGLHGSHYTAASCIIRTCLLDELLLRVLAEDSVGLVVNLGAGLDARPYRLPLSPSLRWLEVDSPEILEYKASKLAGHHPVCPLERMPLDLAEDDALHAVLGRIATQAPRALVLTEGLLVYLTTEQVASLAVGLSVHSAFRWWLSDLISPAALHLMNQAAQGRRGDGDVTLRFAPENGPDFFLPHGWEMVDHLSCLDAAFRLDRWVLDRSVLTDSIPDEQWDLLQRLFTVVRLRRSRCCPEAESQRIL